MSSDTTRVTAVIPRFWLQADVRTAGNRIADVLADYHTDYVSLYNVEVYRPGQVQRPLAALEMAAVPKGHVQLVVLPESDADSPPAKRYHRIVEKQVRPRSFLALPDCIVRGSLHQLRRDNALHTFLRGLADFFPVTAATISPAGGGEVLEAPVVIVNKSLVACFCTSEATAAGRVELEPGSQAQSCSQAQPGSESSAASPADDIFAQIESLRLELARSVPQEVDRLAD